MDHLTQISNTTGEVVSGALKTTGEVVGGAFNWAVEHPVAAVFSVAAVVFTVAFAPEIIALLAAVSSVELIEGAVASTLIGIAIFNDKGE